MHLSLPLLSFRRHKECHSAFYADGSDILRDNEVIRIEPNLDITRHASNLGLHIVAP
jgi:hypothetical protein